MDLPILQLPGVIRACLFDLDGVLTNTATVHAEARKETFDEFLGARAAGTGEAFVPFDVARDYDECVLSISERTREIGMLRAIGTTRSQMRRMIRYESVMTAVLGALLGVAVGIVFGFVVTRVLASEGLAFSLPLGQIAIFMALAIFAGVLAAVLPARRAARLNVLQALQYE